MNRLDSLGIPLIRATFDNVYLFQATLLGNFQRFQPVIGNIRRR